MLKQWKNYLHLTTTMIQKLTLPLFNLSNYTQEITPETLFRYNLLKFAEDLLKNNQRLEVSHTNGLISFAEFAEFAGRCCQEIPDHLNNLPAEKNPLNMGQSLTNSASAISAKHSAIQQNPELEPFEEPNFTPQKEVIVKTPIDLKG